MAYIYKITNDINGKMYVGKTEFDTIKRFKEHCHDRLKRAFENRPLYRAMNKYGPEHFHIEVIEETDDPEEREVYWIEKLGTFKYGYNATIGGDGKRYLDYDLIIATYKEVQNMKETAKLCGCSIDSVSEILREFNVEVLPYYEVIRRAQGKPIGKYDRDTGQLLEVFPSKREAELSIGKKSASRHIAEVAKGKRKTAYGFVWKYMNEKDIPET